MRGGGGRTKSRGSLRGKRKQSAKSNDRRLRSGSGATTPGSRSSVVSPQVQGASTVGAVASSTSSQNDKATVQRKSKPAKAKKRRHLERFVPEQRHLYGGDQVVKLPCPETKR